MKIIEISKFNEGLRLLEDPTKAPIGSARLMTNMMITDRGGIGKRPGTELLGTLNVTNDSVHGIYSYGKSNGQSDILLKAYDDEIEYYHPTAGWSKLKDGFTTSQEFGFKEHNINFDSEDYVYFCNKTENYQRWPGVYATVASPLTSGGTTLTVDSVLYDDVMWKGTAGAGSLSSSLETTSFTADQWNTNFYAYITSGGQAGAIRQITDTSTTGIEFTAFSSSLGAVPFEIRKPKFPASGTLRIGSNTRAYTAIPTYNTITVSTGLAQSSGEAVTLIPTEFPAAPRGNRLDTLYTRMYVGNAISGMQYSTSGSLEGTYAQSSVFVSRVKNASDFTFAASRAAGEGDIQSLAYGKGQITDVACQEDTAYIFKKDFVLSLTYTQDSNDLAEKKPVSTTYGSVARTVKGENDIYFATEDNQITSIGRISSKDVRELNINIGYPVKRLLDTYDMSDFNGIRYKNRLLFTVKDADSTYNDRILVFNEKTNSFEGEWTLGAYGFAVANGLLYYGQSTTPNVYKMFTGTTDQQGSDTFGITGNWRSNWFNLTPTKSAMMGINALYVEGYITGGTSVGFDIYKDFSDNSAISCTFTGTESDLIDSDNLQAFLGANPLGTAPLGSISDPDAEGRRHFFFIVYFPFQYSNDWSIGVSNSGKNQDFEITRFGLSISEDPLHNTDHVKQLNI